jgi:uncharacterized protein YndB with AHSA1/START domain
MTFPHETDVLVHEVRIAARPETVFAFFTDPEKMVRWKAISADLEPRPGGLYRAVITHAHTARGQYLEIEPFSRIVFTWGWEGDIGGVAPGSTTVEVTFIPDGEATLVRLRHVGLPADQREVHAQGWGHYLPRLAAAAEGRDPGHDAHQDQPMGALHNVNSGKEADS